MGTTPATWLEPGTGQCLEACRLLLGQEVYKQGTVALLDYIKQSQSTGGVPNGTATNLIKVIAACPGRDLLTGRNPVEDLGYKWFIAASSRKYHTRALVDPSDALSGAMPQPSADRKDPMWRRYSNASQTFKVRPPDRVLGECLYVEMGAPQV